MTYLQIKGNKKFLFLLIVSSAIFNFSFLEYNNYLIRKDNPGNIENNGKSLAYGQTVFSVDNEYYITPVENYLSGNGWKRGVGVSKGDYFRRVPGYSIVYLFFTAIFEKGTAHLLLKIFQLILFLTTIPAIFYLCNQISGKLASHLITILYALLPFISSWAYYTLTESISPFLVVFYFFYLFKAINSVDSKRKTNYYILSSMFFAFGVLTRPYIAIGGLALLFFACYDFILPAKKRWTLFFYSVCIIPGILIGSWTIRNYIIAKEFVPLEKAFYPQSLDRMKPEFKGLVSFIKCWGGGGIEFNVYHEPMYWAAIEGDTNSQYIVNFLNHWPKEVVMEYGYDRLFGILKEHQALIYSYRSYIQLKKSMPDQYLPEEIKLEEKYNELSRTFKKKHFFRYFFISPLIYVKRMVLHSHTANLYFFQEPNRQKKYVNYYRYFLLLVHVSIYLSLALNFFVMRGWKSRLVFVFIPLLYVVFFTVIHREIEQRYMLPILPILIAGMACIVEKMILIGARKNNNFLSRLND
jgi:hypothetical protein